MLRELFKASGFGDRGVRFAYWYEHGTVSAPMPTTYDQLQRWIIEGDFSQAFYINEDELETPERLEEEAASDARIDDLFSSANYGARCDYCGDWCAFGEYDDDWMGTGLTVCYTGEHEAEKAESEDYFYYSSVSKLSYSNRSQQFFCVQYPIRNDKHALGTSREPYARLPCVQVTYITRGYMRHGPP